MTRRLTPEERQAVLAALDENLGPVAAKWALHRLRTVEDVMLELLDHPSRLTPERIRVLRDRIHTARNA